MIIRKNKYFKLKKNPYPGFISDFLEDDLFYQSNVLYDNFDWRG